jgi:hypothetical protein
MKLDSKYFDSIRIARRGDPDPAPRTDAGCQWKGCKSGATHRAPKGRGQDGEYYRFCMEHVRQFNASYNYFEGMSKAEVEEFQKDSVIGHRPTWRLGDNGTARAAAAGKSGRSAEGASRYGRFRYDSASDTHGIFGEEPGGEPRKAEPRRPLKALERKALEALHLPETAGKPEIKAKFKELVKRHHPDANGGDRGAEDKLREIIQAYNYLKQAGLV